MRYTNKQIEELRQIGRDAIDAHLEKLNVVDISEWPVFGTQYYFAVNGSIDVLDAQWTGCEIDKCNFVIGNFYLSHAEAERHVEAMKVQAELRRMPGVCAPPDEGSQRWCIDWDGDCFTVSSYSQSDHALLALAGVWFESYEYGESALITIMPERLAILRDDYLQVPIAGVA